ncbi:MFS general substrate transporter [Plenodomus tracheiphilus IPT5]|uniref:MFS general substrate transporter n=1 Tax=Plenodomus tracheiphilus IPT5 TaxID=1408161 RepID=A0A6A7AQ04_9PLEO|nr:MFS general substrate transporter [Plenodomus tracheiphilus IPT5]
MKAIEKEVARNQKSGTSSPTQPSDIEIGSVAYLEEPLKDGDEALRFLKNQHDVGEMTADDEKRLVRKIDWMIMPLMWGCYCLQYLDKTLVKKYLGTAVVLWGLVTALTCVCKNYGALVATRILLGCFESAVAPSLILITSMWYKKKEQPLRTGIWYLGVGIGTIIGSLISFGFQHLHNPTFTSWQIMFLVVGLITVAMGVSVLGIENTQFKWHQVTECLSDPQTWMLSLITISSNVPNGAVSSYQATLIRGFGFNPKTTALLQLPSGAVSIISILSATYLAGRFDQRGLNVVTLLVPGAIGGALMAFLPGESKAGKLIGNYLTNCIGASLPLLYSWVSANVAGHTKKVTMNAILLMSFCLGNIIGPLTFRQVDAPDFVPAKITIIVTCVVAAGLAMTLRAYYTWENRRRDRAADAGGHVVDEEFLDLTDRENKTFRYRL